MILVWLRIVCEIDEILKEKYSIFYDKGYFLEIDICLCIVLILLFYMSNKNILFSLVRFVIRIYIMIVSGLDIYLKLNLVIFIFVEDLWFDFLLRDEELFGFLMVGLFIVVFIWIINMFIININVVVFMKVILIFMFFWDKMIFV